MTRHPHCLACDNKVAEWLTLCSVCAEDYKDEVAATDLPPSPSQSSPAATNAGILPLAECGEGRGYGDL